MKIVSPQITQIDTDYKKYKKNQCNPCNPWTSSFFIVSGRRRAVMTDWHANRTGTKKIIFNHRVTEDTECDLCGSVVKKY